ncbi:MAG: YtxH domain-containing protein [bacterium]|nr:YtxH domain-containing protein [bacterium]
MNRAIAILGGIGASLAAVYFLDPKKGSQRRALIVDKFNTLKDDATQKISEMSDGVMNKASGAMGDAKGMIGDGMQSNQTRPSQQPEQFKPGAPGHSTSM